MKYLVALVAVAGAAAAATIADYIPACAVQCLTEAVKNATPCQPTDLQCICIADNYRAIYTSGVACVLAACGNDVSVGEVLPAAARMCEIVVSGSAAPTGTGQTSAPSGATTTPPAGSNTITSGGSSTAQSTAARTSSSATPNDAHKDAAGLGFLLPVLLAAMA